MTTVTFDQLRDALRDAGCDPVRAGGQWTAWCPVHPDRGSKMKGLSLRDGVDGPLAHCHSAQCEGRTDWWGDLLAEIGLGDDFDPLDFGPGQAPAGVPDPEADADRSTPRQNGASGPARPVRRHQRETRFPVYDDRTGRRVGEHVRLDFTNEEGKPDKTLWWDPKGLRPESLALYAMDRLPKEAPLVVIAEGEKDTDRLLEQPMNVAAVGTFGSSHTPSGDALGPLAGRRVVLFPDNDAPGFKSMDIVGHALEGIAGEVLVITHPADAGQGWGAADYTITQNWELIRSAVPWVPRDPALNGAEFAKTGFRRWALGAIDESWTLEVSRVEEGSREVRALVRLLAPRSPAGFRELAGQVFKRDASLYGPTTVPTLGKTCAERVGGDKALWERRVEYLFGRVDQALNEPRQAVQRDIEWLVPAKVMRGYSVSVFGEGSAGKSTLVEGIGVGLVTGREVVPGWAPREGGRHRVLYADYEEGAIGSKARIRAICRGIGVDPATVLDNGLWVVPMSRPLTQVADMVGQLIKEHDIDVLLLAPVHSAHGEARNDPAEPIRQLHEVYLELGVTVIGIDHIASEQAGHRTVRKAYGSERKRDRDRATWHVREQHSERGMREVVFHPAKPPTLAFKGSPWAVSIAYSPIEPVIDPGFDPYTSITFEEVEIRQEADEYPGAPAQPRTVPADAVGAPRRITNVDRLVHHLRLHGRSQGEEIARGCMFDSGQVRDIARRAREKGHVIQYDPPGWYALVEAEPGPEPSDG